MTRKNLEKDLQQTETTIKRRQSAQLFALCLLPVLLGTFFSLWYISNAACDVVYTDYIRLIDSYLPDVTDPAKFFVPDILTRIPASFLQRLINVKVFGFSVTFDRICTVLGLALCGGVLAAYTVRKRVPAWSYLLAMAVLFSLIKWEILLNGTCWAHVVSFGLFFLNYEILDRVYGGDRSRGLVAALYVLPFVILLFAGEYIASYTGGLILAYGYCILRERFQTCKAPSGGSRSRGVEAGERRLPWRSLLVCSVIPLLLYLCSRHFAVWEHAGATDMSFTEAFAMDPLFLPRFFIRSFAGAVLGQETIRTLEEAGRLSDSGVLCLGLVVICAYLLAIYLYIRKGLYKKTLFPMILLLTGGMNHVLVTASRWIFLEDSYALSSRYAGQFMIGLFGILLIFGLALKPGPAEEKKAEGPEAEKPGTAGDLWKPGCFLRGAALALSLGFLLGNCYTTWDELKKMPYREENYEKMSLMVLDYRNQDIEALCSALEWRKDPEDCLHALEILEENHWNVFRQQAEAAAVPAE